MRAFVAVIGFLFFSSASAQFAGSHTIDYPIGGVVLGNGWSSLTATKTPSICVEFAETSDDAQDQVMDFDRVFDREQLNRTLDISGEYEARAIAGLGGSVKASYSKSIELKHEALNLIVFAKVRQGATYAAPPPNSKGVRLTARARQLLKAGLPQFLKACGDGFVSAIYTGGEINAHLELTVNSADEREAVYSKIRGEGLISSGSGSLNHTLRRYKETNQLHITMLASGGSGRPLPIDEAALAERIKTLAADVKKQPAKYNISITRYDTLAEAGLNLPASRHTEMQALVKQYLRFEMLYQNMANIIRQPEKYAFIGTYNVSVVARLQDALRTTTMPALTARVKECMNGGRCDIPSQASGLDYDIRAMLPVLKDSFTAAGEVEALRKSKEMADATLARTNSTSRVRDLSPDAVHGMYIEVDNPEYGKARERAARAAQLLANAQKSYPAAVASAMFRQWIDTPVYYRCLDDSTSEYCLTQAARDVYRDKIQALILGAGPQVALQ